MDKEFDEWLKSQVDDIPILPTKEETLESMMVFAAEVLKARTLVQEALGKSVPDSIVLGMIRKTLEDIMN